MTFVILESSATVSFQTSPVQPKPGNNITGVLSFYLYFESGLSKKQILRPKGKMQ
jgi:hypothetical protein